MSSGPSTSIWNLAFSLFSMGSDLAASDPSCEVFICLLHPGDLLVTLRLRSTPYKILGDDLIGEIKIDCFEAMMGCEKQISTLDGEKKISIPAGIQPFKKIRLANLGYPRSLNSRARGNFLIEVKVFIPKIEDLDTVNLLNKVRGL